MAEALLRTTVMRAAANTICWMCNAGFGSDISPPSLGYDGIVWQHQ